MEIENRQTGGLTMANKKRLIDANAVAKDIRENNRENFNRLDWSSKQVCQLLENAPTVDAVEVVHGHWKYGTRAAVCSECGFERSLDDNFGAAIACPNCGAKMDGDGNG